MVGASTILRYLEVNVARKKFCVEFDSGFCFVEAKDADGAEKAAMEEFGIHRGPYKARESKREELDRFIAGNGVVLEG